ncbi:MAG TPA: DUF2513 domain-containing protein [Stellaceae bacterium]|nr:DUF2513 domain-containing protein [Stellaceae bacterium]
MKRDWDCIRAIFAALENKGDSAGGLRPNQIDGFDAELVSYNMKLLVEARLIEGTSSQLMAGSVYCIASSMTWDGHELFDKIRSETLWNKVKSAAREKALPLSFDVVKLLAIESLKSLIGH